MSNNVCEVVAYTQNGAISFLVTATIDNFEERIAEALEQGTVILDTVEGSKLVLNAINVVAIEICTEDSTKPSNRTTKSVEHTPPVK